MQSQAPYYEKFQYEDLNILHQAFRSNLWRDVISPTCQHFRRLSKPFQTELH